jgi:Domain of unknown function (DUF3883)
MRDESRSIFMEKERIKPTEREILMSLVERAGIDVSNWRKNYKGKHPSANPAYCYNWSFRRGRQIALNLRWDEVSENNGVLSCAMNMRKIAKKVVKKARARNYEEAVRAAYLKGLPVRVITWTGPRPTKENPETKVDKRLLDDTPWAVTEYDKSRGQFVLTRGSTPAPHEPTTGGGWPSAPDAAHNAAVEAAAIAFVRGSPSLGEEKHDRQKDNCGWDLEFKREGITLCVEVKGLSSDVLGVELSPNEYAAMERAMNKKFPHGDYRLAIVSKADRTGAFPFFHAKGMDWKCELTSRLVRVAPRTGARLSEIAHLHAAHNATT